MGVLPAACCYVVMPGTIARFGAAVIAGLEPAHRRPCERRDPYREVSRFRDVVDVLRNNQGRWLWVPAFAGTTTYADRASAPSIIATALATPYTATKEPKRGPFSWPSSTW